MSGVCGIVQFGGAPVERETLRKMAEAAGYLGPDGIRYLVNGNAGFAHLALHTTPEAQLENQPLQSETGEVFLAADVRVDNRRELIGILGAKGYIRGKEPTDADLVLAAYLCWGDECAKQIVGDFAFAVWDKAKQRLFYARDPMGVRPLFYSRVGDQLLVASSLASILAVLPETRISRDFLQDLLAGQYERWIFDSAYEGIQRVPPSHSMAAEKEKTSLNRYWVFGEQPTVKFKREEEYVEAFYEIFERAVKDRLRGVSPVGILTSGGLDSSAIACVADSLISRGEVGAVGHIFSCVYDETPGADEREFLFKVIEKCSHLRSRVISCDNQPILAGIVGEQSFRLEEPSTMLTQAVSAKLMPEATKKGCSVLLAGLGGDQAFGDDPYFYGRAINDVPLKQLFEELPHFTKFSRWPGWLLLAYKFLAPLIPEPVRKNLTGLASGFRRNDTIKAVGTSLCEPTLLSYVPDLRGQNLRYNSAQLAHESLTAGITFATLEAITHRARKLGAEMRTPLYDRRLLDFALRLPPMQRFRDGYTKYIMRRAMTGSLPPELVARKSKAQFGDSIERGLREKEKAKISKWVKDSLVVEWGLVPVQNLKESWEEYWNHRGYTRARPLERFLCVEGWLRAQSAGQNDQKRYNSDGHAVCINGE